MRRKKASQVAAVVAVATTLSLLGCASSAPGPTEAAAEERTVAAVAPVEITGLEVREMAPGAELVVRATGPLVWTQYRDGDGRLVLELPNTVRNEGVELGALPSGLVDAVDVEDVANADRPLTRLTLTTSAEAEHELVSESGTLRLTLVPSGEAFAAVPTEPEPEEPWEAPAEPIAEPTEEPALADAADAPAAQPTEAWRDEPMAEPSAVAATGTPDEPWVAPAPAGPPARRLQAVEITGAPEAPVVRILGDGQFAYETFELADPPRFVIDLPGVVNLGGATTRAGAGGPLHQVRVAQFRGEPDPISRVVLDLEDSRVPSIRRVGEALEISFGEPPMESWAVAEPVGEAAPEQDWAAATPPPPPDREPAPAPLTVAEQAPPPATPSRSAADLEAEAEAELAISETWAIEEPARPHAAAPAAPATSDVALYEAMNVQDVVITEDDVVAEPDRFAAQEVGEGERRYIGEPISFSLRDADIREVLRTFASISGLNIVVQPGVSGSVTVELDSVPWDQALEVILRTNNLWYDIEGNIMRIAPAAQLAREAQDEAARRQAQQLAVPLQRIMKRVSYARAAQVSALLRSGILSNRGTAVVDARTNTLILQELPEYMDSVLAIIDQIDIPEPQVMIEARIVETTKRFSRSLGIAWGIDGVASAATGNSTGLVFPNSIEGDAGVNLLTGGSNALVNLTLGNVLDTFNLDITLQAAESEGLVNILSAPKIATLNNEPASIQSGLQIPVQTVSNNTVSVQFVNATLRLNVTPHVTAEGTVLMDINIQKREPQLAFAVVGATNAPIATKEARTRVIVRDGGTTVIGGIYEVSTDQGQDRVPGLANIPVIGNLFKNRRRSDENEELLIFITPRVIKL